MAQFQQQGQPEFNTKKALPVFLIIAVGVFLLISWNSITVKINSGEKGIMYHYFTGLNTDNVYPDGMHFKAPWNKMIIYDVRKQQYEAKGMKVLSSNGLEIHIDVSVLFLPVADEIGQLHGNIGPDYIDKFIKPAVRSAARTVFGKYTPEEIYSSKKEIIQSQIVNETGKILANKHITLDNVMIKSVTLPERIKAAISSKLTQEQELQAYQFTLEKAEKEAQRQKIEAEGKANANRIISASLTDKILKEKGIIATLELAKSGNSKVIVVGGDDGLPLILGNN
jgi:regulator of protease activity HflC (stomatin/prohibitin superfamily)